MLEVLDERKTKELFTDLEKELVGVKIAVRALDYTGCRGQSLYNFKI